MRAGATLALVLGCLLTNPDSSWAEEGSGNDGAAGSEQGVAGVEREASAADGDVAAAAGAAGSTTPQLDASEAAFLAGAEEEPEIEAPAEEEGAGWVEPPDQRYWMVGARWRMIMVPGWLLESFMDFPEQGGGAPFVINHGAGIEFTTRKNRFSITGAVWWGGYGTDGAFVATEKDDVQDPEFVESGIQMLLLTVDFTHSYMFTPWFGITYGGGVGLGIKVAGEVVRREVYYQGGKPQACTRPGDPNGGSHFCEAEPEGWYGEADGRVWSVYPWVNVLLGLRFKVFRHLEINLDGGVGLGFLFGARVNYIF